MTIETVRNQLMGNPFKKGDTVYHPTLGQCCVTRVQGDEVFVTVFQGDEYHEIPELLSFDPWPEPNHTRPFEPTLKEGQRLIVVSRGDSTKQYYGFVSKEDKDKVFLNTSYGRIHFSKSSYFFYAEVVL